MRPLAKQTADRLFAAPRQIYIVKTPNMQYTLLMGWEWIYIVSSLLILPVFIWAIIASIRVNAVMHKYKKVAATANMTAADLVKRISDENGLNITLERASHFAGDHYNPAHKVIALTDEVINSTSVTALAIAAHECGHALQDKENYLPLRTRGFIIGLSNFASRLLVPLILISIVASIFLASDMGYDFMKWVIITFCAIYGLSAVANLVTLPTEFDASRRAKVMLDAMQITDNENERRGVQKVLGAAAQTYVVSLAISLIYFLRMLSFVMLTFGRRD